MQKAGCCYTLMRLLRQRRHRSRHAMSSISGSLAQGQLISPFLCQLTVYGLPPSLARRGIGQQQSWILISGLYSGREVYGGTLYTVCQPAGSWRCRNADACLRFIRDRELFRMPKSFRVGEERVHIFRPGPLHSPVLQPDPSHGVPAAPVSAPGAAAPPPAPDSRVPGMLAGPPVPGPQSTQSCRL